MEEEPSTIVKVFKYNMYICVFMAILCLIFGILAFTKDYMCPVNSYMLRGANMCAESPIIIKANLDEHNKDIYKIIFIVSSVIFSITTVGYCVMYTKIENSGKINELFRALR